MIVMVQRPSGARTKTSKIKHLHQSHDRPNRSARVRNTLLLLGKPPLRRGIARVDKWLTKLIPRRRVSPFSRMDDELSGRVRLLARKPGACSVIRSSTRRRNGAM